MYKARYYETDGTEAGDRELPIWLFDGIVNEHVLHEAIRAYQLNQRQGSASAKTRSEVRGGSKKPWRQKGTGRARHGSIRSPIWEGGGITFPPKPKSWRVDLPRKVKKLARRSAWNARADDGRVLLVEALDFEEPRTKRLREILGAVGTDDGKVLVLTDGVKEAVYLSGRNMPHVKVLPFGDESAYDILWASVIMIERPALESATEDAEERGLDEKARERIARTEAKAELAAELESGKDIEEIAAEAEEEEPRAEAAPEPEEEPAAEEEPATDEDAAETEAAAPEAEEAPEADEAEQEVEEADESAASAVDPDEVELPTVKELPEFLAGFDDPDVVRALQERDDRKTAQQHFEDRIAELTGEEEGDDG